MQNMPQNTGNYKLGFRTKCQKISDSHYNLPLAIIFIVIHFLFLSTMNGQHVQSDVSCLAQLQKTFITDGQDHQMVIHNSKFSQLNAIFYPQFTYRIVVCAKKESTPVEFNLTDDHGVVIFDNVKSNFINEWDFKFNSLTKGIINVKLVSKVMKEQSITIIIGYKITDTK